MALSALDMVVLLGVGLAGLMGLARGFVTEVLSMLAWVLIVVALRLFHLPLAERLAPIVGNGSGAAVLAFALIAGICYFGGRLIANAIGGRTRKSVLGPLDRALGLGFGLLKGLILASLAFLLMMLVIDTIDGGPERRPDWITESTVYPLLNATSASIAEFVDRRRKGEPVFGDADEGNAAD
jgi:membrane protein required for colicin V production